jgi:DNA-binding XRE family transcriptional regulator
LRLSETHLNFVSKNTVYNKHSTDHPITLSTMTPKNEQQQQAKELYFNTDKTQQEIADILNVNRRTVYLWIRNGQWDKMQAAAKQAPGIILQHLFNHISAVNDRIMKREDDPCPTLQETEIMRKLLGMTAIIYKQHAGSYLQAFEELIRHVNKRDHDLAVLITRHADNYVQSTVLKKDYRLNESIWDDIREAEEFMKANPDLEVPKRVDLNAQNNKYASSADTPPRD